MLLSQRVIKDRKSGLSFDEIVGVASQLCIEKSEEVMSSYPTQVTAYRREDEIRNELQEQTSKKGGPLLTVRQITDLARLAVELWQETSAMLRTSKLN